VIESIVTQWPSILLYALVFVLSAALVYLGTKKSNASKYVKLAIVTAGLILPVIFAGIRYGVGRDFFAYSKMVENLQAGSDMYYRSIEPVSTLIMYVSASLGGTVTMFTLFAAITVVFAFLAVRKMSPVGALYGALGYLAYLSVIFPVTLNAIRSGAAISLVMFAFSQLLDTTSKYRLLKFTLWIIAACMLHASAIICLPIGIAVYFATRIDKWGAKKEYIILGVSTIAAIAFPIIGSLVSIVPVTLISNYARFLTQVGDQFFIPIASLVMMAILTLALIFTRREAKKNPKLKVMRSIAMYYLPLSIVVGWLSYYPGLSRVAYFIDPIIVLLVVYMIKEVHGHLKKGHKLILFISAIVLIFSVLMVRNLNWAHALPYNTVFTQQESHDR